PLRLSDASRPTMLRSAIAEMRQHVALEVAAARYLHLDAVLGAQGRHGDRHATGVAELEEDWHGRTRRSPDQSTCRASAARSRIGPIDAPHGHASGAPTGDLV